jgi:hypothetical protein
VPADRQLPRYLTCPYSHLVPTRIWLRYPAEKRALFSVSCAHPEFFFVLSRRKAPAGMLPNQESLGRRRNDVVCASFCHTRDGENRIQMARLGRGRD